MSILKDIPQLARDNSNLGAVMEAVRETLQTFRGYRGNALDKALTLRDATDLGILLSDGSFAGSSVPGPTGPVGATGPSGSTYTPETSPAPTPTGLSVTAGLTSIFITHDTPAYSTEGHGHDRTVVYGAKWPSGSPPTFGSAVLLFEFQGTFGAYPTDPDTRWCIWIKWRTIDGYLSTSPAGGTNGAQATTVLINSDDLAVNVIAAGTAFITDAKIADISAAKLTVGDGTIGGNLKSSNYVAGVSGWLLTPAGYLEASNAVFRGSVYASAGLIGGITIDASSLRAGQTAYDTGNGFYFGGSGIFSIGNSAGNKVLWDGDVLTVVGTIYASAGQFGGSLTAATGSFAGSLSAATGSFAGSLSAATGTFAGSLSAASGTFAGTLTAGAVNAVDTINLAGQAVTIPSDAYTAASMSIGAVTTHTLQTLAFTSSGAKVSLTCSALLTATIGHPSFPSAMAHEFKIARNGTNLYSALVYSDSIDFATYSTTRIPFCAAITDTPGAGAHSYTMTVTTTGDSLPASVVTNRSIVALETKR